MPKMAHVRCSGLRLLRLVYARYTPAAQHRSYKGTWPYRRKPAHGLCSDTIKHPFKCYSYKCKPR